MAKELSVPFFSNDFFFLFLLSFYFFASPICILCRLAFFSVLSLVLLP